MVETEQRLLGATEREYPSDLHLQPRSGENLHFPQGPKPLFYCLLQRHMKSGPLWYWRLMQKAKCHQKAPVSSSRKAKINTARSTISLSLFLYHPEIQPNEKQSLPSRKTKQKPCVLNPHCVQTGTGRLPEQTSSRVKGFPLRALRNQSSSARPRASQPALAAQTTAKRPPVTMTHLTALPRALGEVPKKEAVRLPEKSRHAEEEYLKCSF